MWNNTASLSFNRKERVLCSPGSGVSAPKAPGLQEQHMHLEDTQQSCCRCTERLQSYHCTSSAISGEGFTFLFPEAARLRQ